MTSALKDMIRVSPPNPRLLLGNLLILDAAARDTFRLHEKRFLKVSYCGFLQVFVRASIPSRRNLT